MQFFTGCSFTDLVEFYRSHRSLWQKQQQFLANKAQDDTVGFLQGCYIVNIQEHLAVK